MNKSPTRFDTNTILYVIIAIMCVVMGFQIVQNRQILQNTTTTMTTAPTTVGKHLPNLTLTALDDQPHTLSHSHHTLLIFLHSECPYCDADLPLWKSIHTSQSQHGVRVLGVANEPPNTLLSYSNQHHISFPILLDPDSTLFDSIPIAVTPTKILISPNRQILQVWHGLTTTGSPENELGTLNLIFNIDLDQIPPKPDP